MRTAMFCRAPTAPGNSAPTVNAGSDQSVTVSSTVNLSASGLDGDGTIAGYAWTQVSGTSISFSNAAIANPSFTAPGSAGTVVVRCTVTDNLGATGFDDVSITVNAAGNSAAPSNPHILNYAPGTAGQAVLAWRNTTTTMDPARVPLSAHPVTSMNIYWNTAEDGCRIGAAGVTVVNVPSPATTGVTLTGIPAGVKWIAIAAVSDAGEGIPSSAVKVTIT